MPRVTLRISVALGALALLAASAAVGVGDGLAAERVLVASHSVEHVAGARLPVASVQVADCLAGAAPERRLAVFRGSMRVVSRSDRMWMRFTLQERVADGGFHTVRAPDLDVWHKSDPAVKRFAYRQRVLALAEGRAYRAVVSFRWYSTDGELVRRARRRSATCTQVPALPNLRVARVGRGRPDDGVSGRYRYTVKVVNRGTVAAGAFSVGLTVDGAAAATVAVNALAPGESRSLEVSGPACGGTVTAVVDGADAVRESSERDNRLAVPCLLTGG